VGLYTLGTDLLSAKAWVQTGMLKVLDLNEFSHVTFFQQLHRTWNFVENFAASFCALNFIGGVR
jgi:hypothetical protein